MTKDLETFALKFDATLIRPLKNGLEVRVSNLEAGKHDAMRLIRANNLQLEVTTEGSMSMLKAFLVRPVIKLL